MKVWDAPTRLFHWLLVVAIAAAWWTAEEEQLDWHYLIGALVLGLLVFRLLWGLIGGSTARFASFVKGPGAIIAYLRGRAPPSIGHNPLGALSVLALLGLVALIVGFGLFATDHDGINPGPLSYLIDFEAADEAHELHEDLFDLLLVLVAIHVVAILYYALFKRDNLVTPMITGDRKAEQGAEPLRSVPAWRFILAAALAALVAWWVAGGARPL